MTGRETGYDALQTVATAGATAHAALRTLDAATRRDIEDALVECADGARSTVLLRHKWRFAGRSPSADECKSWVEDAQGRSMTLAMLLGQEMHNEALWCAEHRLGELRPGGYSLEPRYRYDGRQTTHVTPEEEAKLLSSKRYAELEGTLKPDVVIHSGDALRAQSVYDFKFPCVNTDVAPRWNEYPEGHPYEDFHQGQMYERALGPRPVRVVPRLGVVR